MKIIREHITYKSILVIVLLITLFAVMIGAIGYNSFTKALLEQHTDGAFLTARTAAHIVDANRIDEEQHPGEQASIMMTRQIDSSTGVPKMRLMDTVTGKQLGDRSAELDALIEADPFFATMKEGEGMSAEAFDESVMATPPEDSGNDSVIKSHSPWSAGIPYKTEFFSLELPASWEGRWECEESTETREAMSATNYHYSFKLDGVVQFSVECNVFALGPGGIGSTGKRQVEFYPAEVLSDEDATLIRNSIMPIPE